MSDTKDVQKITTLLDLDGIENITKFKYRKTPPKYPKPGTFYWVEEMLYDERDGETKPKWGLWYTTNDYELRRLDSKVYEIVIRDRDDNYIRLTDKDIFDCQELYLIIGQYVKEVHEFYDEEDDDTYKVFKITWNEDEGVNKGLATVEGTVEYVSDSNNMFFMSNAKKYWWVGKRLGDIREGDCKHTIKDNTVSDILDKIIYPTLQPEITEPSVKLNIDEYEDDYNVINLKNIIKKGENIMTSVNNWKNSREWNVVPDRGYLTYPTAKPDEEVYPMLEPDENNKEYYYYAGESCTEEKYDKNINTNSYYQDCIYEFSVDVEFETGREPLDNKRQRARKDYDNVLDKCDCEDGCEKCLIPQFEQSKIKSNIQKFSLVFPIWTNGGGIHVQDVNEYVIDYNDEENNYLILEFPYEVDGHSDDHPTKAFIDVQESLIPELYQYNELNGEYDVPVELTQLSTNSTGHIDGINYYRFCRSNRFNESTWYDTQTKSVKYKITIKRR